MSGRVNIRQQVIQICEREVERLNTCGVTQDEDFKRLVFVVRTLQQCGVLKEAAPDEDINSEDVQKMLKDLRE